MKRGMILYVTEGRELVEDWVSLAEQKRELGADAICLATSEAEIAYGWWQMLSRGMQEISCAAAVYDALQARFKPTGAPLRLCG